MKVPPQKKLTAKDDQSGIISALNNFMDFFFRAFDKNVTIEENTPYQIVEFTFSTDSSGVFPPISIKVAPKRRVNGILVLWISADSITATPTWSQSGENVVISALSGLSNSTAYTVRLLII